MNPVALQEVRIFQNPISYPETPDVWMRWAGIFRSQIGRFSGLGLVKIRTLLCAASESLEVSGVDTLELGALRRGKIQVMVQVIPCFLSHCDFFPWRKRGRFWLCLSFLVCKVEELNPGSSSWDRSGEQGQHRATA